jgi:hypothetical protein
MSPRQYQWWEVDVERDEEPEDYGKSLEVRLELSLKLLPML